MAASQSRHGSSDLLVSARFASHRFGLGSARLALALDLFGSAPLVLSQLGSGSAFGSGSVGLGSGSVRLAGWLSAKAGSRNGTLVLYGPKSILEFN